MYRRSLSLPPRAAPLGTRHGTASTGWAAGPWTGWTAGPVLHAKDHLLGFVFPGLGSVGFRRRGEQPEQEPLPGPSPQPSHTHNQLHLARSSSPKNRKQIVQKQDTRTSVLLSLWVSAPSSCLVATQQGTNRLPLCAVASNAGVSFPTPRPKVPKKRCRKRCRVRSQQPERPACAARKRTRLRDQPVRNPDLFSDKPGTANDQI